MGNTKNPRYLPVWRWLSSGAQLAPKAGLSRSYLSKRLRDEVAFTANDIEAICEVLEEDLLSLLTSAARAVRSPKNGRRS